MQTYEFQTYEGCVIRSEVEGHHVAAALDELLQAKQGVWASTSGCVSKTGLCVPFLVADLLERIRRIDCRQVLVSAERGGCMPGMVLRALATIKGRAEYWHTKAVRYDAKHSCTSPPPQPAEQSNPPTSTGIKDELDVSSPLDVGSHIQGVVKTRKGSKRRTADGASRVAEKRRTAKAK